MAGLLGLLSDAAELTSKTAKVAPKVAKAGEVMSIPAEIAAQFVKAADPAHIRGAEIMDMLKSGRGSEVTDQMLDMGDPVLNARLNEYLYKNADIPMDEASRMQRAAQMGLTENTIHGTATGKDFSAFKGADRYGSRLGQENYVAPNTKEGRELAAQFSTSDQGRIMPLFTPKPLDARNPNDRARFEQMMDEKNRLDDFRMSGGYSASGLPSWGKQWAIDTANEAGVPAMKLHERDWVTSDAVFDPTKMRSQFARFDPRLSHLKNLSASVGAGLLGANMMPNNDGSR
jgi:hypothetical protein